MKKIIAVLVAVLCIASAGISVLAYERSADAAIYTDFNAEDATISETGGISCESGVVYLNGKGDNTTVSIVDGAAKIEMDSGGFAVFGQDAVEIRDASGNLKYNYVVLRIKGESGNENRTQSGGILLFIGGGDGAHAITLNDRSTGVAPAALDANGQPMNAISTDWQEFVIKLNESNVRRRDDGKPVTGFNINTVSVPATLYIDDIYFTNTAPKTAAVYDPSTATAAVTEQNSDAGDSNGSADTDTEGNAVSTGTGAASVAMLEPPVSSRPLDAVTSSSNIGLIVFIADCAVILILCALFVWIYIKVIRKKLQ